MTTVVWDGQTLAADGLVSEDDCIVCSDWNKLYVSKNKSVCAGIAGDLEQCMAFFDWLEKDGLHDEDIPFPSDMNDFSSCVFWRHKGKLRTGFIESRRLVIPWTLKSTYAIGSGAVYARGALAAGASAKEAVQVAIGLDTSSGGKIRTLDPDKVLR